MIVTTEGARLRETDKTEREREREREREEKGAVWPPERHDLLVAGED